MTRDSWEMCLGALCAWREARGDGIDGMRGVLHVINNRHKLSGKGWEDEIAAHNQFSSMTVLGDSQTVIWPTEKDHQFDQVLDLVTRVYQQIDPDPTGGATFYYNPATATSKWFWDNIANSPAYEMTIQLKHHQFFRKKNL